MRLRALLVATLALAACGPKPTAPPPPTPAAPAAPPAAAATNQAVNTNHAGHASHGKGKREVTRWGVDSLDVAVDGNTLFTMA